MRRNGRIVINAERSGGSSALGAGNAGPSDTFADLSCDEGQRPPTSGHSRIAVDQKAQVSFLQPARPVL